MTVTTTPLRVSHLRLFVVAAIFFLAGMMAASSWQDARGARASVAPVALGSSAGEARKALGDPIKISYDSSYQTWFYKAQDGSVAKKLIINQGLVVRVF